MCSDSCFANHPVGVVRVAWLGTRLEFSTASSGGVDLHEDEAHWDSLTITLLVKCNVSHPSARIGR